MEQTEAEYSTLFTCWNIFLCLIFMPVILSLFSHKQFQNTSKVFENVFSFESQSIALL